MLEMGSRSALLTTFLTVEIITFVVGVFGNVAVSYVIITKKKLRKSSTKYILSTSLADLLSVLITIPIGVLKVKR
jgi:hypothetical protein